MSKEEGVVDQGSQVQEVAAKVETHAVGKGKQKSSGNLIADVAVEVEGLTKSKAIAMADNLAENIEANYFKLGGVLKVIAENTWFEGYESFEVFVFEKYGFQSRKARYLMQIYTDLVTKQIPWEKVSHLGWTKLKDLTPVLTLENLDEWVGKAEKLTVLELQNALKGGSDATTTTEKTTDEIATLKFKLKNDQATTVQHALAKAKGELGTDFDTVALENICAGYLGGTISAGTKDLASTLKEAGWEAVLTTFGELFPEIDISVQVPESN